MAGLSELAGEFYDLREEKTRLKSELKELENKMDEIEHEMLEEMAHEGMNRLDLQGKGSFFLATRRFYKISDKEALIDFLHENNDTDLLTVQHQTLNAYAKEIHARKEAEGIANFVMPGVNFTSKTQIRVRKERN